jgi:hypothetical protein
MAHGRFAFTRDRASLWQWTGRLPERIVAFLLALGAGLRRIEIDRLERSAFQWSHNKIRIEPPRYFEPKTEQSADDVQVDPELMSVFQGYAARPGSSFLIEAEEVRTTATASTARAGLRRSLTGQGGL